MVGMWYRAETAQQAGALGRESCLDYGTSCEEKGWREGRRGMEGMKEKKEKEMKE